MTGTLFLESSTVKAPKTSKGIWRTKLIAADVQGSSGFYPAAVLERDGAAAFPSGTHVYFDHPTEAEQWERPERSVRDLAGVMIEAAKYNAHDPEGPGLYAAVQFFPDVKDQVEAMAPHVGMSIRAAGTVEETDTGRIVTSLLQGVSVDIVTHAGAGGRLVEMTENAQGKGAPGQVPVTYVQGGSGLTEAERTAITGTNTAVTELVKQFGGFLAKMEEARVAREKAAADAATLTVGQITAKLTASGLPAASQTRLAEAYVSGQDFDAAIVGEVAYVKVIAEASGGKAPKGAQTQQQPGAVETDDTKTAEVKESEAMELFDSIFNA